MLRRWRVWLTLALMVLMNVVAWDIRTTNQPQPGVIPLFQRQVESGTEYIELKPDAFYYGSIWYSYALAIFNGLVLPFIVVYLLPWLWRRRQSIVSSAQRLFDTREKRTAAFWLALLAAFNVLAWDVMSFPHQMDFGIPLYKGQRAYDSVYYTGIVPGIRIYGAVTSYVLSILVGIGLPFALFGIWLKKQRHPGIGWVEATGVRKFPTIGRSALVLVPLLVVFNILAWDWVETRIEDELALTLAKRETEEQAGFSSYTIGNYSGIAPGIRFPSKGVSVVASFFVGEILPFLLLSGLFRRQQVSGIPAAPATGAPR